MTPKDIVEINEAIVRLKELEKVCFARQLSSLGTKLDYPIGGNSVAVLNEEETGLVFRVLYDRAVAVLEFFDIDLSGGLDGSP